MVHQERDLQNREQFDQPVLELLAALNNTNTYTIVNVSMSTSYTQNWLYASQLWIYFNTLSYMAL